MGFQWNQVLSQRLDILNTLYPILKIKDYPKRSSTFRELVDIYDPIAIILLIIEDIASTFDISAINEMSIEHSQLIDDILPFLKSIDEKRGELIEEELQVSYIESIIERLCSTDAEFHQVSFIDYLDPNLKMRTKNLIILKTFTSKSNVINYRLDPIIINLFANIGTDIPLDSQVEYNKIVLEKQIKENKIDRAIKIMDKQLQDSKSYYSKIISIIDVITQNYESERWRKEQREHLQEAEAHLSEWINWQNRLLELVNLHFFDITEDQIEDFVKIKQLKMKINTSHGIFVRLLRIVKEARETFYEVHFEQALLKNTFDSSIALGEDIISNMLNSPVEDQDEITGFLFTTYSHVHLTKLHSLKNLINYLFTDYSRSSRTQVDGIQEEVDVVFEEYSKFDSSVIYRAEQYFIKFIKNQKVTSLVNYIEFAREENLPYKDLIISLLSLQVNEINPNMTELPQLEISPNGSFSVSYLGKVISGTNANIELIE